MSKSRNPRSSEIVVLTASALGLQVYSVLGPTNPILSHGYGGWTVVQRPQRKAMTNWDGHAPFQMDLDIWFSEVFTGKSIENEIAKLEKMARVDTDLNPDRPPMIRVHGDFIPQKAKYLPWVIQDLTWGKTLRNIDSGHRMQQQVTVSLMEHVAGSLVHESGVRPGGGLKPQYQIYTIRRGDTLKSIAKKLLGKESRWQEIARINHMSNPRNLTVGRKIRVPRK